MTAQELIEQLNQCDPEKPVCFNIESEVSVAEPWPEVSTVEEEEHLILPDY